MFNPLRYLAQLAATAFAAPTPHVKRFKTGAALRNPADPIQAARIEAAAVKRALRADKLQRDALESRNSNRAHLATKLDKTRMLKNYDLPNRFNPFYVAK